MGARGFTCAADDPGGQSVVKAIGVPDGIHPLPHLQIRAAPQRDGVQPLLASPERT